MEQKGLGRYFEKFLETKSIFKNKKVFQSNYKPGVVEHRDEQVKIIAQTLAPCLKGDKPSNIFVYGKTGTGKTLVARYVTDQILETLRSRDTNTQVKVIYVNCKLKKSADTEYRLIAHIAREMGKAIPVTGLPTEEVYNIFYSVFDEVQQNVILILDEVDQLVQRVGDGILYNLTRINSELKKSQITLLGISNDLLFTEHLDPRVKSSLSEEELIFPPYNALQLQDILRRRADEAFEEGAVQKGTIEKCAAYAAREHGDARRALELLRVAGEIAERQEDNQIRIDHIDLAEEKIERDRLVDSVRTQPKQSQLVLFSLLQLASKQEGPVFTGELYELYRNLSSTTGLVALTQRRISDILSELDMLGIIHAKIISKGRYGRTREIMVLPRVSQNKNVQKILHDALML